MVSGASLTKRAVPSDPDIVKFSQSQVSGKCFLVRIEDEEAPSPDCGSSTTSTTPSSTVAATAL